MDSLFFFINKIDSNGPRTVFGRSAHVIAAGGLESSVTHRWHKPEHVTLTEIQHLRKATLPYCDKLEMRATWFVSIKIEFLAQWLSHSRAKRCILAFVFSCWFLFCSTIVKPRQRHWSSTWMSLPYIPMSTCPYFCHPVARCSEEKFLWAVFTYFVTRG